MYISTRELLGQTADRTTYQAEIERHCGVNSGMENLLNEPTLGPILSQMGAAALSNEALKMLANALAKKQNASNVPVAAA